MSNQTEQDKNKSGSFQNTLMTYVKLIDELAGDKSNFRINFQNVILKIDKTRVTLNGEVNFDKSAPTSET